MQLGTITGITLSTCVDDYLSLIHVGFCARALSSVDPFLYS